MSKFDKYEYVLDFKIKFLIKKLGGKVFLTFLNAYLLYLTMVILAYGQ